MSPLGDPAAHEGHFIGLGSAGDEMGFMALGRRGLAHPPIRIAADRLANKQNISEPICARPRSGSCAGDTSAQRQNFLFVVGCIF
jgi:hypothetical protein